MWKLVFLAAAGVVLSACAGTAPQQPNDPYEASNRAIFSLNMDIDHMFLRPTAARYRNHVPEPVRDGLHNIEDNLHAPVVIANDLLQAEGQRALEQTGRFLVNSTLGIGGWFDFAGRIGLDGHDEDFGQTLAVWGVPEGPYVMLPFLGPATPRDTVGRLGDFALDPTIYIPTKRHLLWIGLRQYSNIVDARSRNLESFDDIERDSLDFYASVESIYRQHRASEIRNGRPEP
jgi:phospholipid-binding lipoprotein MlaA